MSFIPGTGLFDMGWPRSLASPTAEGSTGGCLSIKARRSRKSGAFRSGATPGAIRWLQYLNRTRSGSYVEAVRLAEQTGTTPDVQAIRRPGTLKYGTGISFDQEISQRRRCLLAAGLERRQDRRLCVHRHRSAGGSRRVGEGNALEEKRRCGRDRVCGCWNLGRARGVSGEGGLDFLIGDGKLNYAPEYLWESYYSAQWFAASTPLSTCSITTIRPTITIAGRCGWSPSGCTSSSGSSRSAGEVDLQ